MGVINGATEETPARPDSRKLYRKPGNFRENLLYVLSSAALVGYIGYESLGPVFNFFRDRVVGPAVSPVVETIGRGMDPDSLKRSWHDMFVDTRFPEINFGIDPIADSQTIYTEKVNGETRVTKREVFSNGTLLDSNEERGNVEIDDYSLNVNACTYNLSYDQFREIAELWSIYSEDVAGVYDSLLLEENNIGASYYESRVDKLASWNSSDAVPSSWKKEFSLTFGVGGKENYRSFSLREVLVGTGEDSPWSIVVGGYSWVPGPGGGEGHWERFEQVTPITKRQLEEFSRLFRDWVGVSNHDLTKDLFHR